jgi:hypothetical protein
VVVTAVVLVPSGLVVTVVVLPSGFFVVTDVPVPGTTGVSTLPSTEFMVEGLFGWLPPVAPLKVAVLQPVTVTRPASNVIAMRILFLLEESLLLGYYGARF